MDKKGRQKSIWKLGEDAENNLVAQGVLGAISRSTYECLVRSGGTPAR